MIKVGNKIKRNLEEQVQYLTDYHEINLGLAQWGIRVVGQIETANELPLPYDGEYGDAIAVGTQAPYYFYIWTRASIEGQPAYWFPFGEISIVGPLGPKGDKGDKGDTGKSTRWYTGTSAPTPNNQLYKTGDMFLQSNGQVYIYNSEATSWAQSGNIRGPQGIQGIPGVLGVPGAQGAKGEKGDKGDAGGFINIIGQLSSTDQLPLPSTLNNLTYAYLIEHAGGTDQANDHYDLYIQVGQTSATATWFNAGPFNAATLVTVNGEGQNVWNADTKLDKDSSATQYNQVYVKAANGGQGTINVTKQVVADAVPQRQSDGNIYVPETPVENTDAASKKYVDDAVAAAGSGGDYVTLNTEQTITAKKEFAEGIYKEADWSASPPWQYSISKTGFSLYAGDYSQSEDTPKLEFGQLLGPPSHMTIMTDSFIGNGAATEFTDVTLTFPKMSGTIALEGGGGGSESIIREVEGHLSEMNVTENGVIKFQFGGYVEELESGAVYLLEILSDPTGGHCFCINVTFYVTNLSNIAVFTDIYENPYESSSSTFKPQAVIYNLRPGVIEVDITQNMFAAWSPITEDLFAVKRLTKIAQ